MPGIPGAGGAHPLFGPNGKPINGPAVNPVTMGYYYDGLVDLAKSAGFTDSQASTMGAIGLAESNGVPTATHTNSDGTTDYGIWQINSSHKDVLAMGDWRDPATNARMAKAVYDKQGFKAWSTYNSGAYKSDYPVGFGGAIKEVAGLPFDAAKAVAGAAFGWLSPLLNFLKEGAITVGAFVLSLALIFGGLAVMFRKQGALKSVKEAVPLLAA